MYLDAVKITIVKYEASSFFANGLNVEDLVRADKKKGGPFGMVYSEVYFYFKSFGKVEYLDVRFIRVGIDELYTGRINVNHTNGFQVEVKNALTHKGLQLVLL